MTWAEEIKKLDGQKCCFYGSTDNLRSHHIREKSRFPELAKDLENGITLCHKCHYTAHAGSYNGRKVGVYKEFTAPPEVMKAFIEEYASTRIVYEDTIDHLLLISSHASDMGESVNAFINRAIRETMERDNEKTVAIYARVATKEQIDT